MESVLGPPDPETAVLANLHRPAWKRGLAHARVLVRRVDLSEERRIDVLESTCPAFDENRAWFRSVLAELLKVARKREGISSTPLDGGCILGP